MATNSRTHAARGSWQWLGRPVTCREFAAAMYGAGQRRGEVWGRLLAMERWTRHTIQRAVYATECEMGLSFPYRNGAAERWP